MPSVGMPTATQGPKLYRLLWAKAGKGPAEGVSCFAPQAPLPNSSSHSEHLLCSMEECENLRRQKTVINGTYDSFRDGLMMGTR